MFLAEFDALRVEVHDLIDAGDQVFTSFIHGRGQHSGAETSLDGWVVWTVQEGRVTRNSDSRTGAQPSKPPGCRSRYKGARLTAAG